MALPKNIAELSDPSDLMQEVLTTPPRWIIRWGETLLFLLILVLLAMGWLIKYPDRIKASIVLTTPNPPITVEARVEGSIDRLLVKDQQSVRLGSTLAVIKNAANAQDIWQLKEQLMKADQDSLLYHTWPERNFGLGEVQSFYAAFVSATHDYQLFLQQNPQFQEARAIARQLQQYQALITKMQEQLKLAQRKSQLVKKDHQRNKLLHQSQTIADKELEDSEQAWLTALENARSLEVEMAEYQVQASTLERERNQLLIQSAEKAETFQTTFRNTLDALRTAIRQWEEKYVLRAPIAGTVSFFDYWSQDQFLHQGEEVLSIVPEENQSVLGKLHMPVANSGKVATGQKVYVYLENYPYTEYGKLEGCVQSISTLPKNGKYLVKVQFPQGLVTTYQKQIRFRQQLQGSAEIVTQDLLLIERIFNKLRSFRN